MASRRWEVAIIPVDMTTGQFPRSGEKTPGARPLDWLGEATDGSTAVAQAWAAWKDKYGSRPPKKRHVLVMARPERESGTDAD
jgi:hypothetical protein